MPNANCRVTIRRLFFLLICLCSGSVLLNAQYQVAGSATQQSCSCYTLTTAQNTQNGSVWNVHPFNLTQNFDIAFDLFVGCADANGADGVAFVLQQNPTALGMGGGEMGYAGITPSLGVVLDTYQNGADGDPAYDHISININGNVSHLNANNLAGPVQAIFGNDNVEDCNWHLFRITWDASSKVVSVYFGGALRTQATVDLVNTVFGGNPNVYWGMVGATGGLNNEQKFCARLNAGFASNLQGDSTCLGGSVPFTPFIDALVPVTSYWWSFGDNTFSNQMIPPPHFYAATGTYMVSMVIGGSDGCISDTFRHPVTIVPPPLVDFTIPPEICAGVGFRPTVTVLNSPGTIINYTWTVNGSVVVSSEVPNPILRLNHGVHNIGLVVKTTYQGCTSTIVTKSINVLPSPFVLAVPPPACINVPVPLQGVQFVPEPTIIRWMWGFDAGTITALGQTPQVMFPTAGEHKGYLVALGDNGCYSDSFPISVKVGEAGAWAGNDTVVLANQPFVLNGHGSPVSSSTFLWSPSFGLNVTDVLRPSGILNFDTTYTLTVTTLEGCKATDQVRVTVFKGSKIFTPSAFTPNGDGVNEIFKPAYIGIKQINVFKIYNRWGQVMFSTTDPSKGWDGRYNGQLQPAGNYVFVIRATDYINSALQTKGYLMLLK